MEDTVALEKSIGACSVQNNEENDQKSKQKISTSFFTKSGKALISGPKITAITNRSNFVVISAPEIRALFACFERLSKKFISYQLQYNTA